MLACFDIGGTTIKAAVAAKGQSVDMLGSCPTPTHDFNAFAASLDTAIGQHRPHIQGIAISIAGVIDPANGVMNCANIPCIHGRTLARDLSQALNLPVVIANDADCFALSEALEGAGQGHRNVFGIILGTGVGGGLVIDGKIITGAGGYAGEWGHGTIVQTSAGTPPVSIPHFACGCGRPGCVDTIGGARGLERLHLTLGYAKRSSMEITSDWLAGDLEAARTMDVYLDLVSKPLAYVLNIIGSTIVPVGGGLSGSRALITALDVRVRALMLHQSKTPLIVPALQTTNPALSGAALLGFQTMFERSHD